MTCRCRSYNRPEWGGDIDEIIVTIPKQLIDRLGRTEGSKDICLDLCIAPVVLALWAADIPTLGSCCGHNQTGQRSVIVPPEYAGQAREIIDRINDPARVIWVAA